MTTEQALQNWLEHFIVGQNLCPFAKRPWTQGQVKIRIIDGTDEKELTQALLEELAHLVGNQRQDVETTLLAHPSQLLDFDDFWAYMEWTEELLEEAGLTGLVQLVGFHPDYLFEGEAEDDLTHYTNRSPVPLIHLLREESVGQAVEEYPDINEIPARNIEHLRNMNRSLVIRLSKGT